MAADERAAGAPLVVGNWKMHTGLDEARTLAQRVRQGLTPLNSVQVALCPPFPWLVAVHEVLANSGITLGAQTMDSHDQGGYTGEVSPRMLQGLCNYVLLGQYERRIYYGEKDGPIKQKVLAARKHGLTPIVCVGEGADDLDHGHGPMVVAQQVESVLEDTPIDAGLIVAYEPSWTTIGRVTPPPVSYGNDLAGVIRETLAMISSPQAARQVRVLYGGMINTRNAAEIAAQPDLDGLLVGSGSASADNFLTIVQTYAQARPVGRSG
jgi:triosephosphate isomerase